MCFHPMECLQVFMLPQCEPLHVPNPAPSCIPLVAKWSPVHVCVSLRLQLLTEVAEGLREITAVESS